MTINYETADSLGEMVGIRFEKTGDRPQQLEDAGEYRLQMNGNLTRYSVAT